MAISADTRDGHKTLRLLLQPPRSLCASTGHYPHPCTPTTRSLCSPPLPGSCDPGTTSPGEHMSRLRLLQHHADPCYRRLAPHSIPLPSPRPEPLYSTALLTPSCLGEEQTPEGDLHAEAGPNPKLNPWSCVNKEEKGKFSHAGLGSVDQISTVNLMYPASVEYLNRQRIIPKLRQWTLGAVVDLEFPVCDWPASDFMFILV